MKTGQEYAKEGAKQGQKLGEQAFELGKDKGNIECSSQSINRSFVLLANEALKTAKQAS